MGKVTLTASESSVDAAEAHGLNPFGYLARSRRVASWRARAVRLVTGAREAVALFKMEHQLVEIEGSQYGFAVHDDPQYLNPRAVAAARVAAVLAKVIEELVKLLW